MILFHVVALLFSSSLASFTFAVVFNCSANGALPTTLSDSLADATTFFSANADGLDDIYFCFSSSVTGSFPTAASVYQNLAAVKIFTLAASPLVGTIPAEIAAMTSLTELRIVFTGNTGSIPSSIGALTDLTDLAIAGNDLMTGSIPSSISQLTKLETLAFSEMSFTGHLPQLPSSLIEVDMSGCSLSGPLPTGFSLLVNITKFILSGCGISGPLPDDIFNMSGASQILLDKNRFTGTVPATISNLPSVSECFLDGNDFSGTMPAHSCVARIETGFVFDATSVPTTGAPASNDFPVAIVVGVVAVVIVVGLLAFAFAFATFRKRAKVVKRKSKHILEPAANLENNEE